jgi:hypothetical protein
MTRLIEMLSTDRPDMDAIATYLDGLDEGSRRREALSLKRPQQRRLFDAAKGVRKLTLEDMVPASVPAMHEVPHHGRNTLVPPFEYFAKVMVRPDGREETSGELWGYNRGPALQEAVVGPGYYVAHQHSVPDEVIVNYLRIPPRKPAHWPRILKNNERLSFFVYNGTQDILRGVSKHVTIGRAMKSGKWMPAWFILCREG